MAGHTRHTGTGLVHTLSSEVSLQSSANQEMVCKEMTKGAVALTAVSIAAMQNTILIPNTLLS